MLWLVVAVAMGGTITLVARSRSTAPLTATGSSSHGAAAPSSAVAPPAVEHSTATVPLAALEPAEVEAGGAPVGTTADPASSLALAMPLVKIVMYSRPGQPECGRLRDWLLAHGHLFQERDVDADREAKAAWQRTVPGGVVPALDIDGATVTGFDPVRIQAALDYAGARRAQRGH
jgi:hypothetical protein